MSDNMDWDFDIEEYDQQDIPRYNYNRRKWPMKGETLTKAQLVLRGLYESNRRKPQYPVTGIKFTAEDIRNHTQRMRRLMREMKSTGNKGGTVAKNKVNKFYVAATNISEAVNRGHNADWTRPSMAAAIEHAKEILEDNPDRDCVVIVEIKKIVRRASRPIVVENVD